MKINPYVHFAGNCEEAFAYYGKVIGAKTSVIMKVGGSPAEEHMPKDWKDKVLHGEVTIDGHVLMATDAPPSFYSKPQGFSVTLHVDDVADAERKFNALADGGSVGMPFSATFFAKGFGMCVDKFGIPWQVISPMEM
ncbi:MAG: VOC family protein [Rhizobiales bacterium]|nr:VOC family protein [Hyphomicrobiales bacterium]